MPVLENADLDGKVIALFGLGDQIRYANHFVDAMGQLYKLITAKGLDVIGKVDPSEYNFADSEAIIDGQFAGLPVDEEFQPDLTDERISRWLEKILPEFK
jgi:flavodoxin I